MTTPFPPPPQFGPHATGTAHLSFNPFPALGPSKDTLNSGVTINGIYNLNRRDILNSGDTINSIYNLNSRDTLNN